MLFLVKRTYTEIEFVGDEGDYNDEHGFVDEGSLLSLRDTVEQLQECSELSCWPARPDTCQGVWATAYLGQNYETGLDRTESVHVYAKDGKELSSRVLFRLFQLAGLTK